MIGRVAFSALVFFVICLKTFCSSEELMYRVREEQPPDTFVGDVFMDAGLADLQSFPQRPFVRFLKIPHHFYIHNETGVIRTRETIDREDQTICEYRAEETCELKLDVVVQPQQFFKMIRIRIAIDDINDNSPNFHKNDVILEVPESSPAGSKFTVPLADDDDSFEFSVKSYKFFSDTDVFRLEGGLESWANKLEPKLVLSKSLDREAQDKFEGTLVAYDGGEPARSGSVHLTIQVSDVNDNSPVFSQNSYSVTVEENTPINSIVTQVEALDRDAGLNGRVEYLFNSETQNQFDHLFSINETTGYIAIKGIIDYERHTTFRLIVIAKDQGLNPLSTSASVLVHVTDVNDNPPDVSIATLSSNPGIAEVMENSEKGIFVAQVSIIDNDSGPNGKFTCHLNDTAFALKARFLGEFQIVTDMVLDREKVSYYKLLLTCVDFGVDPQTSMSYVGVNVIDENDNQPLFTQEAYEAEVIENNFLGMNILSVDAFDPDEGDNSRISFSIEPHQVANLFSVGEISGTVTANVLLDRERHGEIIRFWVVATDHGRPPRSSSASVIVRVIDVNDERPLFSQRSYSFAIPENYPEGSEVGTVAAQDLDSSPFGDVSYVLESDVFEIHPKTGKIVTLTNLDREEVSAYHVIVTARDGGTPSLSSSASVTIYVSDENDNPPVFLYPLHPNVSLQVSTMTPAEHVICRIKAHDQDSGKNGKIHFYVKNKTSDGTFVLDSELGTLSVAGDLKDKDGTIQALELVAQDEGYPPKMSFSRIYIVVNKSVPFVWKPRIHDEADMNLTLILIIAPVSGVVVTALIAAIVVLCCQEKQRTSSKYNCRLETLRLQQAQQDKNFSHSQITKVNEEFSRTKNFVMEDALNAPSWSAATEVFPQKGTSVKFPGNSCNTYISCPFKATSRKQSSCRSPQLSTKKSGRQCCADGESLKSDYASNTDSGHGPSEEGESSNKFHNQDQHSSFTKSKAPLSKQSQSTMNGLDGYYPTTGGESTHSYSIQPNQMSTFQVTPKKNHAPDLLLDNSYPSDNLPYSSAYCSTLLGHNPSFSYQPHPVCMSSESQRKLLEVEEELSERPGSAEINSDFLPGDDAMKISPSQGHPQMSSNDVINADELCNEIDQLFFGDIQPSKWRETNH